MKIRILHIPTGEIFSTSKVLSKTRQGVEKEITIAIEFIVAPVSDYESGLKLRKILRWKLARIGIEVPIDHPISWIDDFIGFLVGLNYYLDDPIDILNWESISPAEFALLPDKYD